jgi:hypothetical protein
VKDTRKLPIGRLIPFHSGPAVRVKLGSHRATCSGDGLPRRSPPGSLRLPTGSPLQISNESSRSRAAGVMATSDRQGPTPLALSNLSRMFASGTKRNRGRNEPTAPLASRCFGNKRRQPHRLPGRGRGPQGPKPIAWDFARSSKGGWHVGKDEPPRHGSYERAAEIRGKGEPFFPSC